MIEYIYGDAYSVWCCLYLLVYLGGLLGCQRMSLGVTWELSLCRIEPCRIKPTILAQHWNARFFYTSSSWDIKIPKPPHKCFLKIIGLGHFLHFLGLSGRYHLLQLLWITLYLTILQQKPAKLQNEFKIWKRETAGPRWEWDRSTIWVRIVSEYCQNLPNLRIFHNMGENIENSIRILQV